MHTNQNNIIITGTVGAGKSTLLAELKQRGYQTVPEPAREIIAEQKAIDGTSIYERDPSLFTELLLSRSIYLHRQHQEHTQPIFFDRGIPDVIAYAALNNKQFPQAQKATEIFRYNTTVFVLPPWQAIYTNDDDRKMPYDAAEKFGESLRTIYQNNNYHIVEVPCCNVTARTQFILDNLRLP